jgi:hypothetical protein
VEQGPREPDQGRPGNGDGDGDGIVTLPRRTAADSPEA